MQISNTAAPSTLHRLALYAYNTSNVSLKKEMYFRIEK